MPERGEAEIFARAKIERLADTPIRACSRSHKGGGLGLERKNRPPGRFFLYENTRYLIASFSVLDARNLGTFIAAI